MADTIPMRINWVAGDRTRRAYGYLAFEGESMHLICLRDDSVRAAAAGQAAARQFGLVGALAGAAVSAARESGRAKELRELYEAQQLTPLKQRATLNPLSRTIARTEIATLQKGVQIAHTLKLTDGTMLPLESEERTVLPALEEWCATLGVPTEIVKPKPFPWKVVGIIAAIPFALVALHFIISIPYALKNQSVNKARVAQAEAMLAKVQPAYAAISGLTGHPLAEACGAVLQVPVKQTMAYVGPLPDSAKALDSKYSEDYPRITVIDPPWSASSYDVGRLEVDNLQSSLKWAHPSFGQSYSRVMEQPLSWGRVAERSPLRDLSDVTVYIVGKVVDARQTGQGYDASGTATLSAQVLDAKTGAKRCEGDVSVTFTPSTVGFGFMMSQALPLGLLLPTCTQDDGLCHEVHYYAKYAPEAPAEPVAEAAVAKAPAAKAPKATAKRKKH